MHAVALAAVLLVALLPEGSSTAPKCCEKLDGFRIFPLRTAARRPHALHPCIIPLRGGDTVHSDLDMGDEGVESLKSPDVRYTNSSNDFTLPEDMQEALDTALADPHALDSVRAFFTEEQVRAAAISLHKVHQQAVDEDTSHEEDSEAKERKQQDEEDEEEEKEEEEDEDPFETPTDRALRRIAQDPDYRAFEAKMELRAEAENMTTSCDKHQSFAVTQAIRTGSSAKLEQLLRECPGLAIRVQNASLGFTPLHLAASTTEEAARAARAARAGQRASGGEAGESEKPVEACARLLIEAGCDVNLRDESGRCAATYAAIEGEGNQGVLALLLAAGAQLNIPDAAGRSPLHWAVLAGSAETVQSLVEGGADPQLKTIPSPTFPLAMSPVELAVWCEREELAPALQPQDRAQP